MPKYHVGLVETALRVAVVSINAATAEAAKEEADYLHREGRLHWEHGETLSLEYTIEPLNLGGKHEN